MLSNEQLTDWGARVALWQDDSGAWHDVVCVATASEIRSLLDHIEAQEETLTEMEQRLWGTEQALEGACRDYEAVRAEAVYVRARAKDALEEKQRELEDLHDGMERLRAVAEAAELLMQGMVGDDRHRVNTLRLALQAAGYLKEKAE